jgi:RNA polymerase sigma-70 factor (ECF subfamily)
MYVLTETADTVLVENDDQQDELLVARISAGERRLFGLLYQRYRTRAFALAFGMTGQREQAEDLTQEIFLRVFERLSSFHGQAKFATWFYRLALNHCINHCRHERRHFRTLAARDDGPMTHVELRAVEQADVSLLRKELQQQLRSALLSLKPELRALLLLKEIEGLSYEEIAERLDCSTGTVASRLSRGRRLLARKLEGLKGKL